MKRFVFRYQVLLDVRERTEKQEEEVLTVLMGQQHLEQAALDAAVADEARMREAWTEQVSGALDLDSLLTMHASLDGMARKIGQARHAFDLAKARADNQRDILAKASSEAEVMRKLKARDFDAWRIALDKAEAAFIDELATLRHGRKAM